MNAADQVMACLEFHEGKDKSITAEDLLTVLHRFSWQFKGEVPTVRSLLYLIHDMRRQGFIIASCTAGYFKPTDATEAREYLDTVLRSRAMDLLITIRAQRRAIVTQFGRQIRMQI